MNTRAQCEAHSRFGAHWCGYLDHHYDAAESVAMKSEISSEDLVTYAFAAVGLSALLYGAARHYYLGQKATGTTLTYDSV